jgi:hypothetical protein
MFTTLCPIKNWIKRIKNELERSIWETERSMDKSIWQDMEVTTR